MPKVSIEVPHSLGAEEAANRVKKQVAVLEKTQGDKVKDLEQQWDGNTLSASCKVMSMSVSGSLAVEDSAVKIDAKIPMAAMMFKGAIVKKIEEELGSLLA